MKIDPNQAFPLEEEVESLGDRILKYVFEHGMTRRSEMPEIFGVTQSTLGHALRCLIEKNLVELVEIQVPRKVSRKKDYRNPDKTTKAAFCVKMIGKIQFGEDRDVLDKRFVKANSIFEVADRSVASETQGANNG